MRLVGSIIGLAIVVGVSASELTVRCEDSNTGNFIGYYSVRLKHHQVGCLADSGGTASLKLSCTDEADTLVVSVIGYQTREIPMSEFPTDSVISLWPSPLHLPEISVRPHFAKSVRIGKKYASGLVSTPFYERRGSIIGLEATARNRRQWLRAVRFQISPSADRLSCMKFRVTVYDRANVSGRETSAFVPAM